MKHKKILIRYTLLTTFVAVLLSCSEPMKEMDQWETQMAKELQAKEVQLSHMYTRQTVNGVETESESYLQVNILDSKVLEKMAHNKRLMTMKCDEIKDIVLGSPVLEALPAFNNLKLNFIKTSKVLFIESKNTNTIMYKVH